MRYGLQKFLVSKLMWAGAEGLRHATTQAGRATTGPGRAQTGPKSQKTLEGHISLKTCPNRAFEVFLASTGNVDAKKHLKRPIRTSFE